MKIIEIRIGRGRWLQEQQWFNEYRRVISLTVSWSSSSLTPLSRGMNTGAAGSSVKLVFLISFVSSTERSDSDDDAASTLGSLTDRHDDGVTLDVMTISTTSNVPRDAKYIHNTLSIDQEGGRLTDMTSIRYARYFSRYRFCITKVIDCIIDHWRVLTFSIQCVIEMFHQLALLLQLISLKSTLINQSGMLGYLIFGHWTCLRNKGITICLQDMWISCRLWRRRARRWIRWHRECAQLSQAGLNLQHNWFLSLGAQVHLIIFLRLLTVHSYCLNRLISTSKIQTKTSVRLLQ